MSVSKLITFLSKEYHKIKIKPIKGFLSKLMTKRKIRGIALPFRIYYNDHLLGIALEEVLAHEGMHFEQMKEDGVITFYYNYLFRLPLFMNEYRYKKELEAYEASYMVQLIQDGFVNNTDINIDRKERHLSWFTNFVYKQSTHMTYGFMMLFDKLLGRSYKTNIRLRMQYIMDFVINNGDDSQLPIDIHPYLKKVFKILTEKKGE